MPNTYPPIIIPGTEVRILHSTYVDEDYKLFIYLPWEYAESEESYPVLYALDGNFNLFRYFWSLPVPPMIVVGIGYATDDYAEQVRRRFRDYHPTQYNYPPVQEKFQIETLGGGGEHFLSFIRDELIPFIEDQYRTIPTDRSFFGHSSGGAFGLYTLFNQTDAFNRYVIAAPALFWDDGICFAYEREYAEKYTDLPVNLYLAVGTMDESLDEPFVSDLVKFHAILKSRNYEGLDMKLDLLPGEAHMSTIIPAGQRGVQAIFDVDSP